MASIATRRDRQTARFTHHLFWKANWVDAPGLLVCYFTRIPANILYNVLIPVEIAYGIQAIVLGHFNVVSGYAMRVFLYSVGYAVLWTIGGFAVSHNAIAGSEFLQRKVFANYLNKDYDFYSNTYFGALSAQANRLRDAFNEYGAMVTLTIPKQLTIVIAGIAIIGYHSVMLASITILTVSCILVFTLWSSAWRLKYRRLMSEASSELAGAIGDSLSHGATVKSFAAESNEAVRLETSLKKWSKAQYNSWISSLPADAGRMILAAIATAVLLIFTSRLYQHHLISIAIVALAQLYVVKMVSVTQDVAEIIKSYEQIMSGAYQPVRTMMVEATVLDKPKTLAFPDSKDLTITLKHVDFHYSDAENNVRAITDFSLSIAPGEKVGIVGYSGSGKTTLTKMLLRYMDVTSGSIQINAVNIRDMQQSDLRGHIAYVPQEPLLFHRSIAENIAYGRPNAVDTDISSAAHAAYVDDFVNELPHGYNTLVGERGIKLSGGQRQRVAIARAILKDAPILVLDEATSALDSRSEKFIQKALWHLMNGRTTLVIAHRLSTIQHMDRIVVMDKGRIVQIGTHDELLAAKRGIYARLWEHQSGGYIGIPSAEVLSEVAPA